MAARAEHQQRLGPAPKLQQPVHSNDTEPGREWTQPAVHSGTQSSPLGKSGLRAAQPLGTAD